MARLISEILKEKEPDFSYRLAHYEKLAGSPSADLRLLSDMTIAFQRMASSLGLDGTDTTARELFFAINKKALEDSDTLAQKLGISESDSPRLVVTKCVYYLNKQISKAKVWRIKSSSVKKDLKNNPPKKTLKILGLRSLDSALKREPLAPLVIFAKEIESSTWRANYTNNARRLTNSDFDNLPIDIVVLSADRQNKLKKSGVKTTNLIRSDQEMGSIVVMVPPKRFKGDVLYLFNSLIEQINSLKIYSLYLRSKSVQPDFFDVIYRSRQASIHKVAEEHLGVGWQAFARSKRPDTSKLEEYDFDIDNEQEQLAISDFMNDETWNSRFLLKADQDLIISCNLSDVIVNAINELEPEDSIIHHGQSELRNELFSRYLDHDGVYEFLIKSEGEAENG